MAELEDTRRHGDGNQFGGTGREAELNDARGYDVETRRMVGENSEHSR